MMSINRRIFEKVTNYFSTHLKSKKLLKLIYQYVTLLVFLAYPLLLVYVLFAERDKLLKVVLVPLGTLILVTLLRKIINRQRPYEQFETPSVFDNKTEGKSMPSRHTASAFIIAAAFTYVNPVWGAFAFAAAALIALSRIAAGSHYISDVAVAIIISMTIAYLFFFI